MIASIVLENREIRVKSKDNIVNLYLKNGDICKKINIAENVIDIHSCLDEYFGLFFMVSEFDFYILDNDEYIENDLVKNRKVYYLFKDMEMKVRDIRFNISIYLDKNGKYKINIKPITEKNEICFSVKDLKIDKGVLSFRVYSDEHMIQNSKLKVLVQKTEEVITYEYGENDCFKLSLKEIIDTKVDIIRVYILYNEKLYEWNFKENINLITATIIKNNQKYFLDAKIDSSKNIFSVSCSSEYSVNCVVDHIYKEKDKLKLHTSLIFKESNYLIDNSEFNIKVYNQATGYTLEHKMTEDDYIDIDVDIDFIEHLINNNQNVIKLKIGIFYSYNNHLMQEKEIVSSLNSLKILSLQKNMYSIQTKKNKSEILLSPVETNTQKLKFKPYVSRVEYKEEALVLSLELKSKYDFSGQMFKFVMNSRKENKEVVKNIFLKEGTTEILISSSELQDLKNLYNGEWDLKLLLPLSKELDIAEYIFMQAGKTPQKEFNKRIILNQNIIDLKVYPTKAKARAAFKVTSIVGVKNILNIYISGNTLKVKYRTYHNIEQYLDKKCINTSIKNKFEELECKHVKKNGKKTYTCTYKCNKPVEFVEQSLISGVYVTSRIDNDYDTTYLKELDRFSICMNTKERIVKSKKYRTLAQKIYRKLFIKLPIKKNKIMFESFLGRNISGNPKYVYEYFIENNLDKKYDLIWILNDTTKSLSSNLKKVRRKSFLYYYHMATSKYWVFNARQGDEIIKRKDTVYIQTWHGTPLKTLGEDMVNDTVAGHNNIELYKQKFYDNSRRWDVLIAQNDYSADIFKRAFWFDKPILRTGYPANDILYKCNNEESILKLKHKFNLPIDKKVILYAPTWRDNDAYKKGHYKMNMYLDLQKMQEKLKDDYIIILRMHYLITSSLDISNYKGFVYNLSDDTDIQELYLVSDLLITDYSSTMFDYSNLKRPIIFFAYDLENYRDEVRGFYFDLLQEGPGPVVKTTDEVLESIINIEKVKLEYKQKQVNFYQKFCHLDDGESSKRLYEEIFLDI